MNSTFAVFVADVSHPRQSLCTAPMHIGFRSHSKAQPLYCLCPMSRDANGSRCVTELSRQRIHLALCFQISQNDSVVAADILFPEDDVIALANLAGHQDPSPRKQMGLWTIRCIDV